jgi:hypothetical protein
MPKAQLKANGHVETLNQAELEAALSKTTAAWFQELARGFTTARFGNTSTVAAGAVQVPALGSSDVFGPDDGFAWRVGRISADGLSTNDVLKVYRNGTAYVGSITATSNLSPGKGLILRGGEFLVITGASLTATGDITVTGEAISASELDIYKLF